MRVRGSGPAPVLPAPLWQAGRLAGQLRSAVPGPGAGGFLGLALMSLEGLGQNRSLSLSEKGGPEVLLD